MEDKRTNNQILKSWKNVNSNGNGNGNGNGSHSSIMYEASMVGGGLYFSVGDSWTSIIEGVVCSYKVLSIEDIVIPAGKYRCFKISEEMNGIMNHYWFASNVGLVKCEIGKLTAVLQNTIQSPA